MSEHTKKIILSLLLFACAALLNAFMDRVETKISFNASVFNGFDPEFFCKEIAAHAVDFIPGTKYRPDAWHLAKSSMICFLSGALALAGPFRKWHFNFLLFGVLWNLVFNSFYGLFGS